MQIDSDLMAYCGVDCSACPDYTSGKCPGCRQSIGTEGDRCMPVECCMKKGIIHCGACECFPCADMAEFFTESEGHRLAWRRLIELRHKG